jgi:hypothetical protein
VVLVACYIPYHFSLALLCVFLLTLVAALVFLVFPRGDGVVGGFVGFGFCTEHISAAPTRNVDAVGHRIDVISMVIPFDPSRNCSRVQYIVI